MSSNITIADASDIYKTIIIIDNTDQSRATLNTLHTLSQSPNKPIIFSFYSQGK